MGLAQLFFDNDTYFDRMLSARLPSYFPSSSSAGWVDCFKPKFDIVQKEVSDRAPAHPKDASPRHPRTT
jgi:hypothetical protein